MNITPLKVTVREVVTGYVDDSDRFGDRHIR